MLRGKTPPSPIRRPALLASLDGLHPAPAEGDGLPPVNGSACQPTRPPRRISRRGKVRAFAPGQTASFTDSGTAFFSGHRRRDGDGARRVIRHRRGVEGQDRRRRGTGHGRGRQPGRDPARRNQNHPHRRNAGRTGGRRVLIGRFCGHMDEKTPGCIMGRGTVKIVIRLGPATGFGSSA